MEKPKVHIKSMEGSTLKQGEDKEEFILNDEILIEIAKFYPRTDFGRDLVTLHQMDSKDIKDFLREPNKYKELFNIDDDDIEYVQKWIQNKINFLQDEEKRYEALKEKYSNNLFKESFFEDIPKNFESVFHFTTEDKLDGISHGGLKPTKDVFAKEDGSLDNEYISDTLKVDQVFDQYAPEGFNRSEAVYAFEDYHVPALSKGNIVLEVKVDPEKVLIAEGAFKTEAIYAMNRGGEFDHLAQSYWSKAISLYEFRKLSLGDQMNMYNIPEVVIPYKVSDEFMRVCFVE
jgi:hypothetical protein